MCEVVAAAAKTEGGNFNGLSTLLHFSWCECGGGDAKLVSLCTARSILMKLKVERSYLNEIL